MTDQNIAIRLKLLIEELGISNSQFADECDISKPTLSQLVTGRNKKVSDVVISQIHKAYPDLSVLWLLFGEGSMWNGDASVKTNRLPSDGDAGNKQTGLNAGASSDVESGLSQIGKINVENPRENPESPISVHHGDEYSKDNPLKSLNSDANCPINKDLNDILKNADLLTDLAKKAEKPRKVIQITIYYDDSTFETFYPGK